MSSHEAEELMTLPGAAQPAKPRRKKRIVSEKPPPDRASSRIALQLLQELASAHPEWFINITPDDGAGEKSKELGTKDLTRRHSPPFSAGPPAYVKKSSSSQEPRASTSTIVEDLPEYGKHKRSASGSRALPPPNGISLPPPVALPEEGLAPLSPAENPIDTMPGAMPGAMPIDDFVADAGADDGASMASCPMPTYAVRAGLIPRTKRKPIISHVSLDNFKMWNENPCLLFVVRRSGCPMCRAQALLISHSRLFLKKLGYSTICVFNTTNGDNASFQKYWNGAAYIDESLSFHRALGAGEIRKANPLKESFTPGFAKRITTAIVKNRVLPGFSNKTAGPVLGGMMLFLPGDAGVCFTQNEDSLGDFGDFGELMRMAWQYSTKRDQVSETELEEAIESHERRVKDGMPSLKKAEKQRAKAAAK